MFDIGFSELMVIGVVALVVIGPEKLPKVARTVGTLLGRAQRYVNDVKSDINRQMELDELRKLQSQVQDAARDVEGQVRGLHDDLQSVKSSFDTSLDSAFDTPASSYTPERDWAAEAHARRVRNRVRDRLKNRRGKRSSQY